MAEGAITYAPNQKSSFVKRFNADGSVWMEVVTHDEMVKNKLYKIIGYEFGTITGDFTAGIFYYYVGIACSNCPPGVTTWMQIGGYAEGAIHDNPLSMTKGHAFSIVGGNVVDSGVPYSGQAGQFAIATEDTVSSTVSNMMLIPDRIITIG